MTTALTASRLPTSRPPMVHPSPVHPSTVRRLPLPAAEPPYDDERLRRQRAAPPPLGTIQGTLALSFLLPTGLSAVPEAPNHCRSAGGERGAHPGRQPARTPAPELPDPVHWARRFVQAVVEVLTDQRPVSQLVRWTVADVLTGLQGRMERLPPRRPGGPAPRTRAHVRSVHVKEPADGVAEVCAIVMRDRRVSALALRLEGLDGRWQCTALEVG